MNTDPKVMEFFPNLGTPERSNQMVDDLNKQLDKNGYTFWAVERLDSGHFIGMVGLNKFDEDLPFCPCVEIGWRLAFEHWGKGFATEAANKCMQLAFYEFALIEVVSFTTLANSRSRHVMEKIGMQNTGNNFMHPSVPKESNLQEHCLYRKLTSNI